MRLASGPCDSYCTTSRTVERLPLELSQRIYEAVRAAIIHLAGLHYEKNGNLEFVHSMTGLRTLIEASTSTRSSMLQPCLHS